MYRDSVVAVVMPVHNEQAHIGRAIERVPKFVDHIIAVDDGSTDDTLRRLSRSQDQRLIVIKHVNNRGVGAATKTGYRRALSTGAELIAVMDGDGQMDGNDLPRLLGRALNGADYVKGNRFLNARSVKSMPTIRYLGNRLFSWLTRLAESFEGSLDAHCGYTVIRRRALEAIPLEELYDRYGFPTEMFFAARRAGLVVENVSVRTIYADEVSDINPLTAVPTILYLIARNFLRRALTSERPRCFKSANAKPAEYHLEA